MLRPAGRVPSAGSAPSLRGGAEGVGRPVCLLAGRRLGAPEGEPAASLGMLRAANGGVEEAAVRRRQLGAAAVSGLRSEEGPAAPRCSPRSQGAEAGGDGHATEESVSAAPAARSSRRGAGAAETAGTVRTGQVESIGPGQATMAEAQSTGHGPGARSQCQSAESDSPREISAPMRERCFGGPGSPQKAAGGGRAPAGLLVQTRGRPAPHWQGLEAACRAAVAPVVTGTGPG